MDKTEINPLDTSQFSFSGSFEEQTQEIFQNVRLSRQEVEYMQKLIDDISEAFNAVWTGSIVIPFGSIVSGLGIKTSDMDCFIELPKWLQLPDTPTLVMNARNILKRRREIFNNPFAVIHAKVPIVKFFHAPTARQCDVSFNSSMGVQNSRLIAYLINLDERALKLAILIKYWFKLYNLSGTNLFPSYSVTMLVIFFLQTKNILPAISALQENGSELYINGWNAAFDEITYDSTNDDTLYRLVGDFFKYYRHFKFDQLIVSPFVGHPVSREVFAKSETVPEEFYLYKCLVDSEEYPGIRLDSDICVQDPLEHNRNCTVSVYTRLAQKIFRHFAAASTIYDQTDESSFLEKLLNIPQFKDVSGKKKPKAKQLGPQGPQPRPQGPQLRPQGPQHRPQGVTKNKVAKTFTINIKKKMNYANKLRNQK